MPALAGYKLLQLEEEERRRNADQRTLFIEDFRSPANGMWNDGCGSAARDSDIWFNGCPTCRLDTQGVSSSGATSPGRTAVTTGVVFKRRIHDSFSGTFALELWFRFTSLNITSNTFPSISVYNRDGTSAWHGRLWLDPNGNNSPLHGRVLDGVATPAANPGAELTGSTTVWADIATVPLQYAGGSHLYDPSVASGRGDKVGGWHYAKLVVNLAAKRYVSATIDNVGPIDLSSYQLDQTTSSGFAGMHFSAEFCASTTTRRYMNIAQVRGLGY